MEPKLPRSYLVAQAENCSRRATAAGQTNIDIGWRSRLFFSTRPHESWSFHTCAHSKRQVLMCQHARLAHHDEACNDSERNLRSHEPVPVDVFLQHGIK